MCVCVCLLYNNGVLKIMYMSISMHISRYFYITWFSFQLLYKTENVGIYNQYFFYTASKTVILSHGNHKFAFIILIINLALNMRHKYKYPFLRLLHVIRGTWVALLLHKYYKTLKSIIQLCSNV